MMKSFLIILLLITPSLHAAVAKRIHLRTKFRFATMEYGCSNFYYPKGLNIVLEVEGNKALRAKLQYAYGASKETSLLFTDEETANIKWVYDHENVPWLVDLPVTLRISEWLMNHSDLSQKGCKPLEAIETITASEPFYHFDLKLVSAGISASHSQLIRYSGTLKSGAEFSAELSLDQGL